MARQQKRRMKGDGSITKLPNGRLKKTITIGYDINNKQRRKSITASSMQELAQKEAELRLQYNMNIDRTLTFKEVYERFKTTKTDLVYSTMESYKGCEKEVFEPLYKYPIDQISASRIDELLDGLRTTKGEPYAPSTILTKRKNLKAIFNFAVAHNLLDKTPFSKTKRRPKGKRKVDTVIIPSEDDIKLVLSKALEADTYNTKIGRRALPLYPFILLSISTGLRLGEQVDIDRHNDIDVARHTLTVRTQATVAGREQDLKTSASHRVIYVNPNVLSKVLEIMPESDKTNKLWQLEDVPFTYMGIRGRMCQFLKKCTFLPEGFTFHCFRHYHATYLLKNGTDIKEVSKRLGHSSIKTTLDTYAHWLPELDEKAGNSIGNQFLF